MTIEDKQTGFAPHHLGGTTFMWECPTSAIPGYIWSTIDLFFLCYIKVPGLNSVYLQRQSLPTDDPPVEQDYWLMSAFEFLESAFLEFQVDLAEDRQVQQRAKKGQQNIKKRGH